MVFCLAIVCSVFEWRTLAEMPHLTSPRRSLILCLLYLMANGTKQGLACSCLAWGGI